MPALFLPPGAPELKGEPLATSTTPEPTRRDFLYIATGSVAAVGAAMAAWPLIDQMNPSSAVLALASIEVESDADPGRPVG